MIKSIYNTGMKFMGLLSLYLACKANGRAGDLEEWMRYSMGWVDYLDIWVKYNLECINHLSKRVNKLERENAELKKNKTK
jgi:hypothetical protein